MLGTNFAISMLMAAAAPAKFETYATNPSIPRAHEPYWLPAAQIGS
jgi:hypothetical protein